ncbi:MAG: DUF58 domain-containing protein [Bacteroidales bacterium]|nr:DUF58 domain-containing protein [Bacteroidales bacterium]
MASKSTTYPPEIAISLNELAKLEYLISDFSLLPRQPVHSVLSGKHASKLRGRGLDFAEVRQYVRGDDVRNIDWKVTARTKVTHTKVFTEEKERPAFIIVDQSSSMFFASQGTVKSVIAAQIAAIGGFKVLKAGDRIGGIVFNDSSYESIQPKRSRKTLMHFLEQVSLKNQALPQRNRIESKQDIINKVLFHAQNSITHDYVVVVISDFQHLNQDGRRYLTNIARHNDVINVIISDPLEMNLPETKIPVGDGQNQVLFQGTEPVRNRYNELSRQTKQENIDYCLKYGIPVMELNTSEPLVEQIKNSFGKR